MQDAELQKPAQSSVHIFQIAILTPRHYMEAGAARAPHNFLRLPLGQMLNANGCLVPTNYNWKLVDRLRSSRAAF
jgi:hypothetical protein